MCQNTYFGCSFLVIQLPLSFFRIVAAVEIQLAKCRPRIHIYCRARTVPVRAYLNSQAKILKDLSSCFQRSITSINSIGVRQAWNQEYSSLSHDSFAPTARHHIKAPGIPVQYVDISELVRHLCNCWTRFRRWADRTSSVSAPWLP